MRSAKSYFDRQIYLTAIKRFWPLWAAYIGLWFIIMPLPMSANSSYGLYYSGRDILAMGQTVGLLMTSCMSILTAMAVFSFLYSQRSVNMFAALPIKREGMFQSQFFAGLSWMFGAHIVIFIFCAAVQMMHGSLQIEYLLMWLGMVTLQTMLFYGLASLCAMLTGVLLVLPVLYVIFNFVVVGAEYLLNVIFSNFVYGISARSGVTLGVFSPIFQILSDTSIVKVGEDSWYYDSWGLLGIYAAVGVLFAAAAMLLYRSRHMETATDVIAVRPLKPVFKYCVAFGFSLALGLILFYMTTGFRNASNKLVSIIICMLIAGAVGYFAAEMMLRKTFRVFKKGAIGYGIFAVVLTLLMVCMETDVFGYESYIPPADKIVSAEIYHSYRENSTFTSAEGIEGVRELHSQIVQNKRVDEKILGSSVQYTIVYVDISYELKNGTEVEREYMLPVLGESLQEDPNSTAVMVQELLNTPEGVKSRYGFSDSDTLTYASVEMYVADESYYVNVSEESAELTSQLYEAVKQDLAEGTLGLVDIGYNPREDRVGEITLEMRDKDGNYSSYYFSVLPECRNTAAFLNSDEFWELLNENYDDIEFLD